MARATVTVLLLILMVSTLGAAQAPAESPEASKVTGGNSHAEAPEVTKKAKSPEAAAAPTSRKSGHVAAPPSKSSRGTSSSDSSLSVSAGDMSSPPAPLAAISPIAAEPTEDLADVDNSGASALWYSATVAIVAGAIVAAVIFA